MTIFIKREEMDMAKKLVLETQKKSRERDGSGEIEARWTDSVNAREFQSLLKSKSVDGSPKSPDITVDLIFDPSTGRDDVNLRLTYPLTADEKDVILTFDKIVKSKSTLIIEKSRVGRPVDFQGFPMRLNCRLEIPQTVSSIPKNKLPKLVRLKSRWSFQRKDGLVRVDLTSVRSIKSNGSMEVNLSELQKNSQETYEIEVEWIGPATMDAETIVKNLISELSILSKIMKIKQENDDRQRVRDDRQRVRDDDKEHADTMKTYTKLTNMTNFIGVKPNTLELDNFVAYPSIFDEEYMVTAKADGERKLLMIPYEKDGTIYMVSEHKLKTLSFERTTLKSSSYRTSLLDGEHIVTPGGGELFLVFDAIYVDGSDVHKSALPERLSAAKKVVNSISGCGNSMKVKLKDFYDVGKNDIDKFTSSCSRALKDPGFPTDGLIFTPTKMPLPITGGRWSEAFKWKPVEKSTIDFRVNLSKDPNLSVRNDNQQVCAHAILMVGISSWIAEGHLTTMSMLNGEALNRLNKFKSNPKHAPYGDIQFENATIALACVDGRADVAVDSTGREIRDRDIIECSYDKGKGKWIPLRHRDDKKVPNNISTARSVWRTIQYPISEEVLTDRSKLINVRNAGVMVARNDEYYMGGESKLLENLRVNHNEIKRFLYRESVKRADGVTVNDLSVMDMGCGRCGDMSKWIDIKAAKVYGIDKSIMNIVDPDPSRNSAHFRILTMKKTKDFPKIVCVVGDISKDLTNKDYQRKLPDAEVIKVIYSDVGSGSGSASGKLAGYVGFAREPFDIIACMFTVHYMFDRKESLVQFAKNIKVHSKVGSRFIGCCLDDESVIQNLSSGKADDVPMAIGRDPSGKVAWRIVYPPASKVAGKYGRVINVYVSSIGQELPEYLVSFKELEDVLREHGDLKLLDTKLFKDHSNKSYMSPYETEFSHMHRWFMFERFAADKLG
jgi:SAM-dependent methyltransferase